MVRLQEAIVQMSGHVVPTEEGSIRDEVIIGYVALNFLHAYIWLRTNKTVLHVES